MRPSYVSRPAAGPHPGVHARYPGSPPHDAPRPPLLGVEGGGDIGYRGFECATCEGSRVVAIGVGSILQSAISRPRFMLSLCILRPAEAYLLALGQYRDYAGHGRMSISMLWVRGAKTNWAFARRHQIFNSFVRLSRDSRFNSIAASLRTESLIISLPYSSSSRSLESLF